MEDNSDEGTEKSNILNINVVLETNRVSDKHWGIYLVGMLDEHLHWEGI